MSHVILAFGLLESWDMTARNGDRYSDDKYPKGQNNGLELFYMYEEMLRSDYEHQRELEEDRRYWERLYVDEYGT